MTALLKNHEHPASEAIQALAAKHGISYRSSSLDELGDRITYLSGDNVSLDEIERLLVELGRAKIIDGRTQIALATAYQSEM